MVDIEINGKKIQAREGAMVIEAADEAGVSIPRFCYHKKLSIAANCRMCLVEVEKVAKCLPACATPVTEGMKVFTKSDKAIAAQKGVMEFLLINHPLDCPICDQGGECELQDVAMGYGQDVSAFSEQKRVVGSKDFGPLISGDMTRCIHCTRCVRFGDEIAGVRELGATGRGEHMEIGTYVQMSIKSEMSGNVIDLCPVGALTSKPFRYTARAWELAQRDSIAPHDCLGSNIHMHVRRNEVVRVVPKEHEQINEVWLSDRDRFGYEGLNSEDRLTTPKIKVDGEWRATSWEDALSRVVSGFMDIKNNSGAEHIGTLISPSSTIEEMYLAQKLMRDLGTGNIDHRLSQVDFAEDAAAPAFPWLGQSIEDLEKNDAVLLIGSNIRVDQPIAAHRLRKAAMQGAKIMHVNAEDFHFNFPVTEKCVTAPNQMLDTLAGIAAAMKEQGSAEAPAGLKELVEGNAISAAESAIAQQLTSGEISSVILGTVAFAHPDFSRIRALATAIAGMSNSRMGYLTEGANSAGAWLAGAVPHRDVGNKAASVSGKSAAQMLADGMKGMMIIGAEPELDCANGAQAESAISNADFVVYMTAYTSPFMEAKANVLLPISPFSESSGTFVNAEGRWQSFEGAVSPKGEARPGWKVLRVLGNLFSCKGFDYVTSTDIRDELKQNAESVVADNRIEWQCPESLASNMATDGTLFSKSAYACDAIVRRASALQTADQQSAAQEQQAPVDVAVGA